MKRVLEFKNISVRLYSWKITQRELLSFCRTDRVVSENFQKTFAPAEWPDIMKLQVGTFLIFAAGGRGLGNYFIPCMKFPLASYCNFI